MIVYRLRLQQLDHSQSILKFDLIAGSWANMEPTWVMSAPGGPHVDTMNLAICVTFCQSRVI